MKKISSQEYKRFFSKNNKFNAKTTKYDGTNYHSKLEASYAMKLDWQLKGKLIKSWSGQHKIELYVNGMKICNYYMDFRVVNNDGSIEYHEVKGYETDVWKLKWKLLKATISDHENAELILAK
jgi:hypothetical protein